MVQPAADRRLPVRFYFVVEVDFLVPQRPKLSREKPITDELWIKRAAESLADNLQEVLDRKEYQVSLSGEDVEVAHRVLPERNFQSSLRSHRLINEEHRLYRASLVVSTKPHSFSHADIIKARKGAHELRIKAAALSTVRSNMKARLTELLEDVPVVSIKYEYHTSRTFVFWVYLAGYLEIRHTFSPETIKGWGGSIQSAISEFNKEVQEVLKECPKWDAEPKSSSRRPSDSIYKFDLHATVQMHFAEDEVYGDMNCLESEILAVKDPPELDFSDDVMNTIIEEQRSIVADALAHYDVAAFDCNYVDHNDAYEIAHEIVYTQN